jgi:aldehyde:ferredoxin oxidoreductase
MPKRAYGDPPLTEGPLKGVTIDRKKIAEQFFESMDWDKESMLPTRESLEKLGGLEDVIRDLYS